jgi:hypothetical protein
MSPTKTRRNRRDTIKGKKLGKRITHNRKT